ncbi:hypothetical protein [Desulforhabdus sp. TSK]|uniref:hypothetical protein n=1 Tax=Desulforhabdus sp. TSK TaxID=2925014 RepID=UPI001FC89E75|nr:hypothetical protein [Desulforhabdus sp. TSK]
MKVLCLIKYKFITGIQNLPVYGRHLLIYGSYLAWSCLLTWPLVANLGQSIPMPSYIHDRPWVHSLWGYLWWLWTIRDSLLNLHALPIYTDYVFFPVGIKNVSAWIQCIYPSLLFIPLATVFNPIVTGNILLLLSLAAGAYAAFLLGRHCIGQDAGAYVTGFAYAFATPQQANAQGHLLIMTALPLIPLFILFFMKLVQEEKRANVYRVCLIFLLLCFSYWYYTTFVLMFALIYLALLVFSGGAEGPRSALWKLFQRLLGVAGICGVVLVPVLWFIYTQEEISFASPKMQAEEWSVDLLAFFLPSHDSSFFGTWTRQIRENLLANPTIQSAYLGYPFLILAVASFFQRNRKPLILWTVVGGIFALLALGPVLHIHAKAISYIPGTNVPLPMPFLLLHRLPILNSIRDCSMFLVMPSLCLAVLAGYGVSGILRRVRCKPLVFSSILAICFLDSLILPFPTHRVQIPDAYTEGELLRGEGTLVDIPLRSDVPKYQFDQIFHRKHLLTGSFTRMPEFYNSYGEGIWILDVFKNPAKLLESSWNRSDTDADRAYAAWVQHFFKIDTVAVHTQLLSQGESKALDRFLHEHFQVLKVRSNSDGTILYGLGAVEAPELPTPFTIDFRKTDTALYLKKGWAWAEPMGPERTAAWSTEKTSELFVLLDARKSQVLSFSALPFSYPGAPRQTVTIYLNDRNVKTLSLNAGEWGRLAVPLPPEALVDGVNAIKFEYGYVASPSDVIPGSTDTRKLGAAFESIELATSPGF